jgi:hemoglobin-like flavoprotein
MTSHQIELVQSSFVMVEPVLENVTLMLYDHLFELNPPLRRLFHSSRKEQVRKLTHVLTVFVRALSHPQQILAVVEELGRRHLTYGVREEHYATFGEALLWALQTELGDSFSPDVREAWASAYLFLASRMERAAANAIPRAT